MPERTPSELESENLTLKARLAELELRLAANARSGEVALQESPLGRAVVREGLRASEIRYRRLFETAKDGILILDADTGKIADSNPFVERMLGFAHGDLLGKQLWEIGSFKDIEASRLSFKELQEREYVRYENLPLETHAGERIQVEFISNVYLVEGRKVIQCNIRDITARKLAEARLQEANDKLSTLVETLRRRESDLILVNRYNDLLQTCETQDEAYRVIALLAGELFLGQSGCLAVFHPSGRYLEAVARWGQEKLVEDVFSLNDCWAIRRGRPHEVMDPATALHCTHFTQQPAYGYMCLPLSVHGETLGVFHLSASSAIAGEIQISNRQLAVIVGEGIKASLANLKLREQLHEQATRDPLTGLFNRRYLADTLPRELHRAVRGNAPLCLAMLDLDNLKRFNDSFGHEAGDLVLRELGRVLRENLRKSDIACRYGGEEFVLVLPDSMPEGARQRLDAIRKMVERLQIRCEGQDLGGMTFSGGIASAPENGSTTQELIRAADEALYAAKQAGRNRVVTYERKE
jgi:diguanylate cyclase (GGDEF)-like protein/PAS domain S-box-containing protein